MSTTTFEPATLPDSVKQEMCEGLLAEFNTEIVRVTTKGELICRCPMPWHNDNSPSASLNYKKLAFNCFSCGSHGGLLWFISSCRDNSTGKQARDWVEGRVGLGQNSDFDLDALLNVLDAIFEHKSAGPDPIPVYSKDVLKPWRYIHDYLTDVRKIPEDTIIKMKCGWDPDKDRIVIPHFWKGDLVGWQSRRLRKDGTPKYLSTAEFPRDRTLYNAQNGGDELAVVVEAPMSSLRHLHHMPEIKGTFGSEVTDAQVRLLSKYPRIVLFPDPDSAGWNSVTGKWEQVGRRRKQVQVGLVERLIPYSDVRVVQNPWAADPADLDDETVQSLVDDAVPAALWQRPKKSELQLWKG